MSTAASPLNERLATWFAGWLVRARSLDHATRLGPAHAGVAASMRRRLDREAALGAVAKGTAAASQAGLDPGARARDRQGAAELEVNRGFVPKRET